MTTDAEKDVSTDNQPSIVGDVIGDTAYSERFVLKILLKLANLKTLKEEMKKETLEQELCMLWDMTTEKDVVLYLLTHDALNLFTFALPVIHNDRIVEIIIGTMGNMCCHKEAVDLLTVNIFTVKALLEYFKSDSCDILIQLFRLVSSCLYVAEEHDLVMWLKIFHEVQFPKSLHFILEYSANKEVLVAALETFNTISINCQSDTFVNDYSAMFENEDTPRALHAAHLEYCKHACPEEELERLHIITLQIMLHLFKEDSDSGSDEDIGVPKASKHEYVLLLLQEILCEYEKKIKVRCNVDSGLIDVFEAAGAVIVFFKLSEKCSPSFFFKPCCNMWKNLSSSRIRNKLLVFMPSLKTELANIMCTYMLHCTVENLKNCLDDLGNHYDNVVQSAPSGLVGNLDNRLQNVAK